MHNQRIYLDFNASAPLEACARDAMVDAMDLVGNASSIHHEGRTARKRIENARLQVAESLGVSEKQVVFTSGASEAAAMIMSPEPNVHGQRVNLSTLYVGATEHPCVMAGGSFPAQAIKQIGVDSDGVIDLNHLSDQLSVHDHKRGGFMVGVMAANNETGVLQPIGEIAKIVHSYGGYVFTDAVQAYGKQEFDFIASTCHFAFVSSHKMGGPKGVGALILANSSIQPVPLIKGGGQENFLRGGTENVAAIAGFGAAATKLSGNLSGYGRKTAQIRDAIETGISEICKKAGNLTGPASFMGKDVPRLPNTSCFAVPGIKAETAIMGLDLEGIAVSSGSACSSGKVRKSHVLEAMKIDDEIANCALRVSVGGATSMSEAERFLDVFGQLVNRRAQNAPK